MGSFNNFTFSEGSQESFSDLCCVYRHSSKHYVYRRRHRGCIWDIRSAFIFGIIAGHPFKTLLRKSPPPCPSPRGRGGSSFPSSIPSSFPSSSLGTQLPGSSASSASKSLPTKCVPKPELGNKKRLPDASQIFIPLCEPKAHKYF